MLDCWVKTCFSFFIYLLRFKLSQKKVESLIKYQGLYLITNNSNSSSNSTEDDSRINVCLCVVDFNQNLLPHQGWPQLRAIKISWINCHIPFSFNDSHHKYTICIMLPRKIRKSQNLTSFQVLQVLWFWVRQHLRYMLCHQLQS